MKTQQKIFSNLIWRFLERSGAQIVALVVSIVLARILDPEAYGTIALISVFITILNVFVDSGFANALIQKKDADDLDFSTVFYFNLVFCIILYLIAFITAPVLAGFYNNAELTPLIRVLSLTILISGVKNVQQAYVSKTLQFKKFFYATAIGTIGAAVLGIWMAYQGFGVWALVGQQVFNTAVDTLVLWITVKWRPKLLFSFSRLKSLFSYGWKLLAATLIDTAYNQLTQLIIGKKYSSADLAYYNQGDKLPNMLITNIDTSINSVLLPVMSDEQDNVETVRAMTRRAITVSTFVIAPMMMGLAFMAPILIRVIFTEKWLPCVFFLRIFCINYMFYPIHTANLNAIKALGRSDIFLKLEILKKIVGFTAIFISMWFGVKAMAYSVLVVAVINQMINAWPNKKLLGYHYAEQLRDIMPNILLSLVMGIVISVVPFLGLHDILTMILQILLGIVFYMGASLLLKMESASYMLNLLKTFRGNKHE